MYVKCRTLKSFNGKNYPCQAINVLDRFVHIKKLQFKFGELNFDVRSPDFVEMKQNNLIVLKLENERFKMN